MALSIGVRKGSRINVGGDRVGGEVKKDGGRERLVGYKLVGGDVLEVLEVEDKYRILVSFRGQQYMITDQERTKLAADVFLSCGLWNGKGEPDESRLAFEAPRSIRIERLPR